MNILKKIKGIFSKSKDETIIFTNESVHLYVILVSDYGCGVRVETYLFVGTEAEVIAECKKRNETDPWFRIFNYFRMVIDITKKHIYIKGSDGALHGREVIELQMEDK